jgi:alkylation response protein AidB-like acyl-CoA dehydrogenase
LVHRLRDRYQPSQPSAPYWPGGKPTWKHKAVGDYLADMATKYTAARQLVLYAAGRYDAGTAPTWKLAWPSSSRPRPRWRSISARYGCMAGYAYTTEFDVERYFRDAPPMIAGEVQTRSSAT